MQTPWTPETLAMTIETVAEGQVIERLGYPPALWYYGGSQHNDYRLCCTVLDTGDIEVSDGVATEIVSPDGMDDLATVQGYVAEWLDNTMPHDI